MGSCWSRAAPIPLAMVSPQPPPPSKNMHLVPRFGTGGQVARVRGAHFARPDKKPAPGTARAAAARGSGSGGRARRGSSGAAGGAGGGGAAASEGDGPKELWPGPFAEARRVREAFFLGAVLGSWFMAAATVVVAAGSSAALVLLAVANCSKAPWVFRFTPLLNGCRPPRVFRVPPCYFYHRPRSRFTMRAYHSSFPFLPDPCVPFVRFMTRVPPGVSGTVRSLVLLTRARLLSVDFNFCGGS